MHEAAYWTTREAYSIVGNAQRMSTLLGRLAPQHIRRSFEILKHTWPNSSPEMSTFNEWPPPRALPVEKNISGFVCTHFPPCTFSQAGLPHTQAAAF